MNMTVGYGIKRSRNSEAILHTGYPDTTNATGNNLRGYK